MCDIGSASFKYDMRRLSEILAFPRAWYRRSIARRLFLGDQTINLPGECLRSGSDMRLLRFISCSFLNVPSRRPSPRLSLGPRHAGLCRERRPAPVPRVQPQSLLEDVGRRQHGSARSPIPQRLLGARRREQHVPGRRGPPQVPGARTHQERVRLLRSEERWAHSRQTGNSPLVTTKDVILPFLMSFFFQTL